MGTILPEIVLFGDSITQYSFQAEKRGWGTALANRYARTADVVLRGFSGYNTRWVLPMLDKTFPAKSSNPPLLVTVFFGANDAAVSHAEFKSDTIEQHVPLPEYKENLHKIVAHLKNLSDHTHVVLITPPPIYEKALIVWAREAFGDTSGVPKRRNELAKMYAEECVKVGEEMGVPVLNLWSTFQETPNWQEKLLCDGLHLSAEGNVKVFEELVKILDGPGLVPTLNASDMPWDIPSFHDLGVNPVAYLKEWSTPR
ncbi:unnamed protein product [Calypogeia fissa]